VLWVVHAHGEDFHIECSFGGLSGYAGISGFSGLSGHSGLPGFIKRVSASAFSALTLYLLFFSHDGKSDVA
jgi:hypothetical protein